MLYRVLNDDDDDDDSTNKSILLILNPCHDDSWGFVQGFKGFRADVAVPGRVRID
jgi:hypothetical protein